MCELHFVFSSYFTGTFLSNRTIICPNVQIARLTGGIEMDLHGINETVYAIHGLKIPRDTQLELQFGQNDKLDMFIDHLLKYKFALYRRFDFTVKQPNKILLMENVRVFQPLIEKDDNRIIVNLLSTQDDQAKFKAALVQCKHILEEEIPF